MARIFSFRLLSVLRRNHCPFSPEYTLGDEGFISQRKEQVAPFFKKLEKQLEKKISQVAPSTALGRAIAYTIEVLPKVKNYLELACLTSDNNTAERAIRPFVVGRNYAECRIMLRQKEHCNIQSLQSVWQHKDTPANPAIVYLQHSA